MQSHTKQFPEMILSAIMFFVLVSNASFACDGLSINITYPSDGDSFTAPVLLVNGTASDANHNLTSVQVKVNSGYWIDANGTGQWSAWITLAPGSNIITAAAGDSEGYAVSTSITVTYAPQDTTPPQILELWPTTGFVFNITNNIELGAVTDENATCRYDASDTDYTSMGSTFFQTGGTVHRQGLTLANGTYTYYVRCIDGAGNANQESRNTTFQVNTTSNIIVYDHDVSITGMSAPSAATEGSAISVSATIKNIGRSNETDIPIIFSVDDVPIQTAYFNISSLENSTASFNWAAVLGSHKLSLFANLTTDGNLLDNNASAIISVSSVPPTPPPSTGGGGGGGGGGYYFPTSYNKDAYFSIVTIPSSVTYGDPLYASGCLNKIDHNSTLNLYLDGALKNSTKIAMPSTCFNLSLGIPALGKHSVYLHLKDSRLNMTKNTSVIKKPVIPVSDVKVLELSLDNKTAINVGMPVTMLVRVSASTRSEMSLTLFFDSKKIGHINANVSGEETFPFEYTFDSPGEKMLAAVASTVSGEDSITKKIYVDEKEETPTGNVVSASSSKWWAILILIIIAIAGYYYLKKL